MNPIMKLDGRVLFMDYVAIAMELPPALMHNKYMKMARNQATETLAHECPWSALRNYIHTAWLSHKYNFKQQIDVDKVLKLLTNILDEINWNPSLCIQLRFIKHLSLNMEDTKLIKVWKTGHNGTLKKMASWHPSIKPNTG